MSRLHHLLRSIGAAGAEANARRSCDELQRRERDAVAIERRFSSRRPAAAIRRVA